MNKVILMGRLTRDPDIRFSQTNSGMQIARFSLAVDRRFKNSDGNRDTDFLNCVAFGKTAEFAERYLHQGTKVVLTGRIQTGSYINKDNQKVYTTDIVVEELEFAESKAAEDLRLSRAGGSSGYGGGYNNSYNRSGSYGNGNSSTDSYAAGSHDRQSGSYGSGNRRGDQNSGFGMASAGGNDGFASGGNDFSQNMEEGFMNIPEEIEDEGLPFK